MFTLPEKATKEIVEVLVSGKGMRIERIISYGQVSPQGFWYDQEQAEWVTVLEGEAELTYASGKRVRLIKGDSLLLPARRRHRVSYTSSPCIDVYKRQGLEVVREAARRLAYGLNNLINLIDPQAIIISGEITALEDAFMQPLTQTLNQMVLLADKRSLQVQYSKITGNAVTLGGARYALDLSLIHI